MLLLTAFTPCRQQSTVSNQQSNIRTHLSPRRKNSYCAYLMLALVEQLVPLTLFCLVFFFCSLDYRNQRRTGVERQIKSCTFFIKHHLSCYSCTIGLGETF